MTLDKWIAVVFLALSSLYGYAAFTYPLLPFERNMAFLPNSMPMVLAVLGGFLSLVIVLSPKPKSDAEGDALGSINLTRWREYKVGQAVFLIAAMLAYALALRPLGFLAATILFLFLCGWALGERRPVMMLGVACVGTSIIWFLVQEVLGIFLKPLPWFIS